LACFIWLRKRERDPFLLCALIPIKIYYNAEVDKEKILSENKNKAGIYL
jgi:hypothetical protein